MSASLGYGFKLRNARLDLQLNADNVLNYDTPMYNGMFALGDRLIPYGFRHMTPSEVRLTRTLSF